MKRLEELGKGIIVDVLEEESDMFRLKERIRNMRNDSLGVTFTELVCGVINCDMQVLGVVVVRRE